MEPRHVSVVATEPELERAKHLETQGTRSCFHFFPHCNSFFPFFIMAVSATQFIDEERGWWGGKSGEGSSRGKKGSLSERLRASSEIKQGEVEPR